MSIIRKKFICYEYVYLVGRMSSEKLETERRNDFYFKKNLSNSAIRKPAQSLGIFNYLNINISYY
jgi:hypothetical protein